MNGLLKDFPSGPLDRYRKIASFDWKQMKIFLETEEILEYESRIHAEFQKHPILFPKNSKSPGLSEERRISALRTITLRSVEMFSFFSQMDNLRKPMATITALFQLDPSTSLKHLIGGTMFPTFIRGLGNEHHSHYLDGCFQGRIIGAYCLTEIGHGSNAKCMQTCATYDSVTKEFILHTPNFESAKCWAGLLGQIATHAVVYAQLKTPDGVNHGLHAFIVKIRDPETLLPYPGVTVGDMGEKMGLNGIDNGFLIFNQYRIPKIDLLNKTGDVTDDGRYVTTYGNSNKRYGVSLGSLSSGRISITVMGVVYCAHALTIAIRYAAVRKQFGPEGEDELPILEYQSHQHRLIPYLSVAYILKIFGTYLMTVLYQFTIDTMIGEHNDRVADLGLELHAISSACKPVAGWVVRDAIQECREACGGHGYLKVSGIGDLKTAHEVNLTYEGENHVLIQQTSNWLLKFWPLILEGQSITSPLKSVDFLTHSKQILAYKFQANTIEEFMDPNSIIKIYQWLVCYLLKTSYEKCEKLVNNEKLDSFTAKNESQVFLCKNLAIAYTQHFMIQHVHATITEATNPEIKKVLLRLLSLYGIWSLEKHFNTLYEGGFASGTILASFFQTAVLKLCRDIKDDAVALIDAIAPPDFLIKSVLGRSDGLVYKHLEKAFMEDPKALTRPDWWKEVVELRNKLSSKL